MWKDSYSLGIKLLDEQHKELFKTVEHLLNVMQNEKSDKRRECISTIEYLKGYTIKHFKDEEDFQRSINYCGLDEHVKVHEKLIRELNVYERQLRLSDYSMSDIKDFIGMLIAWLVCHVAGDDQLIVEGHRYIKYIKAHSAIDSFFYMSACDVISNVANLNMKDIKVVRVGEGDFQPTVSVSFNVQGDVCGTVTYNYTQQLAFGLMKSMAAFTPFTIDELVKSAMTEISDCTSVKSLGLMAARGFFSKIQTHDVSILPAFVPAHDSIVLDTGMGVLELDVELA